MSNPTKNRKWFIIGGIVLVLIIIGAIVGEDDKTKPETLADPAPSTESDKAPKVDSSYLNLPGLGVTQKELTQSYSLYPHKIEFTEGVTEDEIPAASGSGEDMRMSIVGNPENVHRVQAAFNMRGEKSDVALKKLGIIAFLTRFHLEYSNWAIDEIDSRDLSKSWSTAKEFEMATVGLQHTASDSERELVISVEAK